MTAAQVTHPAQAHDDAVISVSHLVKQYRGRRVVDDVSFSIRRGEIFGVIGPNGAGKTTTVECISGLRVPDAGRVLVSGLSPQRERARVREFLGVQLQESALPPRLRVGEALELFASFYESPLDPRELLDSLAIGDLTRTPFKALSGGQKQRLSIALALVGNPRIAILDELTTGLDPEARRETWAVIESIKGQGVTVVLVTHYMDEAEVLCDRLALINQGRLVALDTPESIALAASVSRVTFAPTPTVSDATLLAVPGVETVSHKDRYVTVTGSGDLAGTLIATLSAAGVQLSELEARRGSLDDAFIKLTRTEPPPGIGRVPH